MQLHPGYPHDQGFEQRYNTLSLPLEDCVPQPYSQVPCDTHDLRDLILQIFRQIPPIDG